MPKLDLSSSHQFWKNYEDPMIYRVIAFMEASEAWTLDGHPELEKGLEALGEALDQITNFTLGKEAEFVQLCAHIKTSRILRILQAIDTIDPGSASKLLMYAEENQQTNNVMATLFLKRNIAFERLRLLARIFSEERLSLVTKALEQDH